MDHRTDRPKSARELAFASVVSAERDRKYSNIETDRTIRENSLSEEDRKLYTRLVYGTIERKMLLDRIISEYSGTPPEKLDADVLNALRMGICQLLFFDRIPEYSAVNETVSLVPNRKKGYVNAVLRSFLRNGKRYTLPDRVSFTEYLSVRYSVSGSVASELARIYGERAESILAASEGDRGVSLRINTLKTDAASAASSLGGTVSSAAPDVVLVPSLGKREYDGIAEGLWFVQDEASRLAVTALGAVPGETVVDTCCCPGGKCCSAAIDMENRGRVIAFDIHGNKLPLVKRAAEKLGIDIIETAERDARDPDPELIGRADRVICDAPCSGIGVIGKKPDIRYRDMGEASKLPAIQYGVLCGSAGYVREGGVLVYSTCTVIPEENENIVTRFLSEHGDFMLEGCAAAKDGMRTYLPDSDGCDGFFIARMRRRERDGEG